MKVGVVGSRSFTDFDTFEDQLSLILYESNIKDPVIISGGAIGVDSMAKQYAKKYTLNFVEFNPYFKLDKAAEFSARHFFVRNRQIVYNSDIIIAFWDGKSKGTKHSIDYANKLGRKVIIQPV